MVNAQYPPEACELSIGKPIIGKSTKPLCKAQWNVVIDPSGRLMHATLPGIVSGMKSTVLLVAVLLCAIPTCPSNAQTTNQYDRNGKFVGSSRTENGVTHYYDGNGRLEGSARTSNGTAYFYGRNGEQTGSERTSNGNTYDYGKNGEVQASKRASGDRVEFYDKHGSRQGSTETSNGTTRIYDRNGRLEGTSSTTGR